MGDSFEKELKNRTEYIEAVLDKYLPESEGYAREVIDAMNYSVMAGGKRLRPMLMLETYRLFGGSGDVIEPFMAAIEFIHTYSLVHDDLPAMDNDEYRRGKKTTWAVYGDAEAILAGDALLNYAFETALKAFESEGADMSRTARALSLLAQKSGIYGMVGGQVSDMDAENKGGDIELSQLVYIHEHKTAALIEAAMGVGAILAGADDRELSVIEEAACKIGVAFQIQDDILDVRGSFEVLGKPIGSDEKNGKATYVSLTGMEKAEKEQRELSNRAIGLIEGLGESGHANGFLAELVKSLITRIK